MARCGCAEQCNCVVLSGNGIIVSGSGTSESPYIIINNGPAGSSIAVSDTSSIDMSITGDGSGGNPYTISGVVLPGVVVPNTEATEDIIGNALGIGLEYDDVGNTIQVAISTETQNQLTIDPGGALIVAENYGLIGQTVSSWKDIDQTKSNTVNLGDDFAISFFVTAGQTYLMEGYIAYDSSTNADFKHQIFADPGITVSYIAQGIATGATGSVTTVNQLVYDSTDVVAFGGLGVGTTNTIAIDIKGYVSAVSNGSIFYRWAQNTAEVSNTVVRAGSWMSLRRVG